jgi:hypothetical protein
VVLKIPKLHGVTSHKTVIFGFVFHRTTLGTPDILARCGVVEEEKMHSDWNICMICIIYEYDWLSIGGIVGEQLRFRSVKFAMKKISVPK